MLINPKLKSDYLLILLKRYIIFKNKVNKKYNNTFSYLMILK